MSQRKHCFRPRVTLKSDTAVTYIPMVPRPDDLSTVDVHIKRHDGTALGENDSACCAPGFSRFASSSMPIATRTERSPIACVCTAKPARAIADS